MNMRQARLRGMVIVGGAAVLLAGHPLAASAQMRGGGGLPATPVATSLDKVPMGTWAEYTIKRGDGPGRKLRQALVGKEAGGFVIETRSETRSGDKMLSRTVIAADPTAEGGVKKTVLQLGDGDPMEMPVGMGRPPGAPGAPAAGAGPGGERRRGMGMSRYLKPDPKDLLGKETVKVAGGSFSAQHYKTEGPRGGTLHYWVSKDAGPFGLVKLEMERPAGAGDDDDGGKVVVELAAKGKGAKPELTKPAKPFDPSAFPRRQREGGGGQQQ